ncbi:MAG: monovalent cation:proton antiporter-2 (CPA2) family protein [Hyphomicrobiaceae bacterium]|nr:monovalent cation:proton antiporter-2 (CPA2) family protein [Hyphomicrobiaceae bacterium]
MNVSLAQVALFLAAAVVAAPLAKYLRIGNVLGYLLVGVAIGPFGLGFVYSLYEVSSILHFAEFGVVLLLFLIGLELRPKRLWAMRMSIFGLGSAQVLLTAVALAVAAALTFRLPWQAALFAGLALSLSSTAFALQILEEKGELALRHGRMAFAVLLFQDLAAIPLLALPPLFAVSTEGARKTMELSQAAVAIGTIIAVVVVGRYLLNGFYYLIARTKVKEAMTASALLTVIGITLIMELAGLSASLGAFIAGVLLADSDYRHEIVADIAPFEGLLLGLFFTAIGMSLNLGLIATRPGLIAMVVLGLLAIKALVLYLIGRRAGLERGPSRRLGLALAQGGEFAFVLFTAGVSSGVLNQNTADILAVAVTLSMAATPLLLLLDEWLMPRAAAPARPFDDLPDNDGHIVIAGFGRVGQIIARVLVAKRIPVTALDSNPEQVDFVRKFGAQIYYGDASRLEILEAAQAGKARGFVLAIDDIEASLRTAEVVRRHYPNLPIYARARTRAHAHRLMDLGVRSIKRETFLSSLDMTKEVLRGLGHSERDVRFAIETFREQDERRLVEDYEHRDDLDKLRTSARSYARELEVMFEKDAAERAKPGKEPDKAKEREKRPA